MSEERPPSPKKTGAPVLIGATGSSGPVPSTRSGRTAPRPGRKRPAGDAPAGTAAARTGANPPPRPARAKPPAAPRSGKVAKAKRIPAYRWRMMVALAVVVSSGFLLGMLLTALA